MWAIVPLKTPEFAKSRLRPLLSDAERRDLYFIMARKVIGALKATPGIDKVQVVTTCKKVGRFAINLGAEVILQPEDKGTAAAFAYALSRLPSCDSGERPKRLLMIPGDLPLISSADLSQLVSQSATQQGVSIVPDRMRIGTNALLCSPPDAIPPCFGSDSFKKHIAAANDRGIAIQIYESEALSLDIDVRDDLDLLRAHFIGLPDSVDAVLRGLLARLRTGAMPINKEIKEILPNDHPL
ncbi:MAG: 2-phospho-L-lactate guanylyltransferase [Georgfuchsia sp.]